MCTVDVLLRLLITFDPSTWARNTIFSDEPELLEFARERERRILSPRALYNQSRCLLRHIYETRAVGFLGISSPFIIAHFPNKQCEICVYDTSDKLYFVMHQQVGQYYYGPISKQICDGCAARLGYDTPRNLQTIALVP